mmetsp:Transcript_11668/g.17131  ORF Transcript_11668/g.17131 Transcript_11668/m.17131 type:complete len:230 (-) Transcript_11668:244-933(-)
MVPKALKRVGKKIRWRTSNTDTEDTDNNVKVTVLSDEDSSSQERSNHLDANLSRAQGKRSSQTLHQSSEKRDDVIAADPSFYITRTEDSTGDTEASESVDLNKIRNFYSHGDNLSESFSLDSRDSRGEKKNIFTRCAEDISYRIHSFEKMVSRTTRKVVEEVYGAYLDTSSGCNQVCNAFTLQEKELNGFHSRLEKANTHLDRRVETLPALIEFDSPPLGMKCKVLNIC